MSRLDTCPDCGGRKYRGTQRCWTCNVAAREEARPRCVDCGKPISSSAKRPRVRCRPCSAAARRGVPSPRPAESHSDAARKMWDARGRASAENLADRFWALVERGGACWLWRGGQGGRGASRYGVFTHSDGRHTSAHRIAYELEIGPIPEGLHVDHLCGTTLCVNPAHLEAVTPAENRRRQAERRRA